MTEQAEDGDRRYDVVVIGGGIVGLATARAILAREPDAAVVVVEREQTLAAHQTGHNSGVVHAGIYYAPGSLKAALCTAGRIRLAEYAAQKGLPYVECGKLVVALDDGERAGLDELFRRATSNGVPDVRMLDPAELREIEPAVNGVAALHSPHTAITDYRQVAAAYAGDIAAAGGTTGTGFEVVGLEQDADRVVVVAGDGRRLVARHVVACAGLWSDRLAVLAGDDPSPRIIPFRGDYYRLRPEMGSRVRGLVYPVPDPRFPFLGIHLTRTVHGDVLVGPNAVLATARAGYTAASFRAGDLAETLRWPGFRRFARANWRAGIAEMRRAASRRSFAAEASRYLPGVTAADLERAPAGVRAQAMDTSGSLVDDFVITSVGRVVSVRNAPSPAATSSLPIGDEIAARLLDRASAGGAG